MSPNLKIVANNKTVGKLEKSKGLKVWSETISINKESKIFVVKKMSNNTAGKGTTIIIINISMATGKPSAFNFSKGKKSLLNVLVKFMTSPKKSLFYKNTIKSIT